METVIKRRIEEMLDSGKDKFIIYPFGKMGMQVESILNTVYGIAAEFVVDNHLYKYNHRIYSTELFSTINCKNYVVLLSAINPQVYSDLKEIVSRYFPDENIVEFQCQQKNMEGIQKKIDKHRTNIGRHCYGPICRNHPLIKTIGNFCSFAEGCDVVPNHEMKYITTHPIIYAGQAYDDIDEQYTDYENEPWYLEGVSPKGGYVEKRKRITIGNDVWLGKNVIITNGANIGNGVIAGAGAVITKDVPDYAIVVGVPARIIKYRYSQEHIDALNKIQWWSWSDQQIIERFDDFYIPVNEFIDKYL